ncbi:MAG: glycine zipper domain-containing protein [Bdellovibrio sp.]
MNTIKTYLTITMTSILVFNITACSTMEKSIVLGTAIGGSIGGAVGSQNGNTGTGSAIGALAGAGLSYLIHKHNEKKSTVNASSEKLELDDVDSPFLKSPKIRKYWQDDKIEGKKFIKGHWVYEIEEQSVWMQ